MLEGQVAGVSVQNVSSTFGSAPKVRIRGVTSLSGENKPLWVVDGVVLEDVVNISNDQLSSGDPTTLLGSSVAGINASDIEKNKLRGDLGISYDDDCLRLMDAFRALGLYVGSIVVTQYAGQSAADAFLKRLDTLGVKHYCHYPIAGYPSDVAHIVSDEGFGKNDYIETTHSLVVVTAPGPGSGKMATCLSQLYHEHKHGVAAGYAKFETFPIWNLPLKHPVNLAYEAATADLNDVNMIDPFHLEAYGKTTVNYNRDVEIFPVLRAMFEKIQGKCPYQSPTDMGVNMAGNCIIDDEVCREASRLEILRRYYTAQVSFVRGEADECQLRKLELVMQQAGVTPDICPAVAASLQKAEETGKPAGAMVLPDGRVVTGKTSSLLGACLLYTSPSPRD